MVKKGFMRAVMLIATSLILLLSFVGCGKGNESSSQSSSSSTPTATISAESLQLTLGEQATLTVSNAEGSVEWETRNESVATVENGTVTATGKGETWIIASTSSGDLYCRVTVTIANVALPVIKLDGEIKYADGYSLHVLVGEKYTLAPVLVVGEETPEVAFTLTASEGITVEDLSFTATAAITNGKVTVSCEYQGEVCTLEIAVVASEEG